MTLPLNRLDDFQSPIEAARFNLIEQQIRPWLVNDLNVLEALKRVKRELFIAPDLQEMAFMDMELALISQDDVKQAPDRAMLAPKIEARFLNDLKVQAHERVLEIGTGSGYMAALLASQAKEVLSLEIYAPLVEIAKANLARSNVTNVSVLEADGSKDQTQELFDVIVISGAVAQVPQFLLEKLNEGGRLIAIVGGEPVMRVVMVERKNAALTTHANWDYKAAFLQNFPQPSQFRF